jgi:GNAT superfamily N-acetyltransferase
VSDVVIREVAECDFARIREIAAAAWKKTYDIRRTIFDAELYRLIYNQGHPSKGEGVERWCRKHPELTRVAELDGLVVGFVTWQLNSPHAGCGEISNNAVDPSAQGQGVGKKMYHWVLDLFRRSGMKAAAVQTCMDDGHAPARAAYTKVGFNTSLEFIRYYQKL